MAVPISYDLQVLEVFESVGDLLAQDGFWWGVSLGLVAWTVLAMRGSSAAGANYGWALLFGVGAVATIALRFEVPILALAGFVVLAVSGLIVDLGGPRIRAMAAAGVVAIGGAVLLTLESGAPVWLQLLLAPTLLLTGWSVHATSRSGAADYLGLLVALTAGGIWVTVPETDMVVVVVGFALAMASATFPPARARASATGALLLSGLLAGVTLLGGFLRPDSVVAGWLSIGLLPVVPAVSRSWGDTGLGVLVVAHFVVIAVLTRMVDAGVPSWVTAAGYGAIVISAVALSRQAKSDQLSVRSSD